MSVVFEPSPPPMGTLYCPTCEKHFHPSEGASGRCPADNTKLVQLAPSIDNLIGRELEDRYTILERLGAGGMGTVYRADQHSMGREVAVKVVNSTHVSDPFAIKRFLREAKLASRLNHPNAVAVVDFGQTGDGLSFLVMELVEGRTLEAVFRDEGRFSAERIIRIAIQVCDALERAHELKIVHRDLKPSNIMVLRTGRDLVKVLDFGLAKSLSVDSVVSNMSYSGELLGTPAFMPPEIANGQDCDERSDIYSLGMTLYFLAVGSMPFYGKSVHEWLYHHAETPPPTPLVPEPLRGILLRMIAKKPSDRFATAADARAELDEALLQLRERRMPTPVPVAADARTTVPPIAFDPRAAAATPVVRVGRAPARASDLRRLELGHTMAAASAPSNDSSEVGEQVAEKPSVGEPTWVASATAPRRRTWLVLLAFATLAIAAGAWVTFGSGNQPRHPAAPATRAAGAAPTAQPAHTGVPAETPTAAEREDSARTSPAPTAEEPAAPSQPSGAASAADPATNGSGRKPAEPRDRRSGKKSGAPRKGSSSGSKGQGSELPF